MEATPNGQLRLCRGDSICGCKGGARGAGKSSSLVFWACFLQASISSQTFTDTPLPTGQSPNCEGRLGNAPPAGFYQPVQFFLLPGALEKAKAANTTKTIFCAQD